jgi:hypothetical protein
MNTTGSVTQNASTWWPEESNRANVKDPLFANVGTVLEDFVGLRARDLWLKTDLHSVIPLPPFASFAYEWGVGDFIQFATKLL